MNLAKYGVLFCALTAIASAQSEQKLADYLKRHPDADANGDGVLTREEAHAHRRRDPSRGDNLASTSKIPAKDVSLDRAPLHEVALKTEDGVDLSFAYRIPPGEGPFPTIVFFHGGGGQSNLSSLKANLTNGPVQTRFLEQGFLTVQSTRRPFWKSEKRSLPSGFYLAVDDAARVVERVKVLPGADPDQVILYGGSGGGILAIVTAAKAAVSCVIAGEPATVVPLDPKTGEKASSSDYRGLMANPAANFTGERREEMIAWMKEVSCPVLVLQGKPVGLYRANFEILIPEMKKLGKDISSITYPGMSHGFYWGTVRAGATVETVDKIVKDVSAFVAEKRGN